MHVRGAFTGANNARVGLLVKASGGTLLLDEIGDMPIEMQTKLLRAIQEKTVRPVGIERGDARSTLASSPATHRDLEEEVEAKRFREDLYYRINVVRVRVPPLRARDGDILRLATHFLGRFAAKAQRGEMQPLSRRSWQPLYSATTGPGTCESWKTAWKERSRWRAFPT